MSPAIAAAMMALVALAGAAGGAGSFPPPPTPPAAPATALIALGDSPAILDALARFAAAESTAGAVPLRADELSRRLRGVPADCPSGGSVTESRDPVDLAAPPGGAGDDAKAAPRSAVAAERECYRAPDEAALARMLADARLLEARFESEQAETLRRQVIEVFERTPQPSARHRLLTGEAWLDLACSLAANNDMPSAREAARKAMRHFGDTPIDTARYSPALQRLFADANAAISLERHLAIHVRTTQQGRLFADGNELGIVQKAMSIPMPVAAYRVWLEIDNGQVSLPYTADLTNGPVEIDLDPGLDGALRFTTPVQLACTGAECADLLARLRRRLGVAKVIAVGDGAGGPHALISDDGPPRAPVSVAEVLDRGREPFSLLGAVGAHPGFVASAATTVVAVIAATSLALVSRSQFQRATDDTLPQRRRIELNDSGHTNAVAANVLFGVSGAAAVTAGVFFWIEW